MCTAEDTVQSSYLEAVGNETKSMADIGTLLQVTSANIQKRACDTERVKNYLKLKKRETKMQAGVICLVAI